MLMMLIHLQLVQICGLQLMWLEQPELRRDVVKLKVRIYISSESTAVVQLPQLSSTSNWMCQKMRTIKRTSLQLNHLSTIVSIYTHEPADVIYINRSIVQSFSDRWRFN